MTNTENINLHQCGGIALKKELEEQFISAIMKLTESERLNIWKELKKHGKIK